jgi:hypothetical protein
LPLTLTAPEHMEVLAKQRRLAIPWLTDDSSTIHWEFVKGKQRCSVKIRSCLRVRDGIGLPEAVVGGAATSRLYRVAFVPAMTAGLVKPILADWLGAAESCYAVFPDARPIAPKAPARGRIRFRAHGAYRATMARVEELKHSAWDGNAALSDRTCSHSR